MNGWTRLFLSATLLAAACSDPEAPSVGGGGGTGPGLGVSSGTGSAGGTSGKSDAGGDTGSTTGTGSSGADAATADAGATGCDDDLRLDSTDPFDAARAIGLCDRVTEASGEGGLIDARYTTADGSGVIGDARQFGLLPDFGVNAPRRGATMLALSSGIARAPDQPEYSDSCGAWFSNGTDGWPSGYPRDSSVCPFAPSPTSLFDPAALEVRLRVPAGARGLSFETNTFTFEYPAFICTEFNDYFVVLMDPKPDSGSGNNSGDANIVFDGSGNWISVNNSLLQVCEPGTHGGKDFPCPLGPASLVGTGYEGGTQCAGDAGAATGWLRTQVPTTPGEIITLRFAIWDSDDVNRDSLVLIDRFQWNIEAPSTPQTIAVGII